MWTKFVPLHQNVPKKVYQKLILTLEVLVERQFGPATWDSWFTLKSKGYWLVFIGCLRLGQRFFDWHCSQFWQQKAKQENLGYWPESLGKFLLSISWWRSHFLARRSQTKRVQVIKFVRVNSHWVLVPLWLKNIGF